MRKTLPLSGNKNTPKNEYQHFFALCSNLIFSAAIFWMNEILVGEGVDYLTGVNNTIQCIMQNTIILRSTIHYYTLYDLTGVNKVEINPPACGWIPSTLWCSSSPLVPTSSSRGSLNFFLEGEEVSGAMNQVTLREDAATANWWDNPPHSYKLSKIKVFLCTSLCNGSHKTNL